MKLIEGKQYGYWTFKGEYNLQHPVATCHLCGKGRRRFLRFELLDGNNEMIDFTELGTECVKNFDFNQTNPYTNKQGVNTSLAKGV